MLSFTDIRQPITVWADRNSLRRTVTRSDKPLDLSQYHVIAQLPPLYPEYLGGGRFTSHYGVRFPYIGGAMANAIASLDFVSALASSGILAFFGAAGLSIHEIDRAINELSQRHPNNTPWGSNLIHTPNEAELEFATAKCYIERRVRFVSASAYMHLTLPIVWYSIAGMHLSPKGGIIRKHNVFAKVSRPETAKLFMLPAPEALIQQLESRALITHQQAQLARILPVAEDITVEADSGGHTDNQSLTALFPVIAQLRDAITSEYHYERRIRLGAAGGIGTPHAAAAAFALGADYIVTGSINQASVEAGLSEIAKKMLCRAQIGDVMMAPAADMFELGVDLQVLKQGTMFGVRARRLRQIYQEYRSLEEIPKATRDELETRILGESLETIWNECENFWSNRDPSQIRRAATDPKHRMALMFRWYLGNSSRWAIRGDAKRALDYQIWCGPAMASFNQWVKGTHLEALEERDVVSIALNIMEGAAICTRNQQLRTLGVDIGVSDGVVPRRLTV